MPLKDKTPLKEAGLDFEIQKLRLERWEILERLGDRLPLTDQDARDMLRLREINKAIKVRDGMLDA